MSRFTHLHTHSHYSLLTALPKIDDLVSAAKKAGMTALGLTDNGNLYGAIEFYKECKKKEIKPIIGVDFYVAARTRKDMQAGIDNRRSRLVLLAINEAGYKNLIQLVTLSQIEGFYYKPRLDRELMEKYNEGLIAISPSFSGEIAQSLKSRNQDKAKEVAAFYKGVFKDRLYVEITRHPEIDGHEANMKVLLDFARAEKIQVMAAHDVYYLKQEDRFARETLLRVNSHSDASEKVSDGDEDDFSFITSERAEELFHDLPEALENTAKIVEMCNVELKLGVWVFPNFQLAKGVTPDDELRRLVMEGYERRRLEHSKDMDDRVKYELGVIEKKGYAPYFLVVSDLLKYAHDHHILTTIRGSVAGSLVTYLAGITNVNPIEYKLPFERFLNPERPSAPDIDMDYADNRRDEMIEYVKSKYGHDKVAQIGTFGTMMARGSVRDVARAMGFPFEVGDRISKLIPMGSQGFPMTLEHALEMVPELRSIYENEEDPRRIIDMAKKIEGCARHISVHAAGVVIAPRPLTDFTPLQLDPKGEGKVITQFDMHAIEDAGLLKFDFLGIRNLAILADAVERVAKIEGIKVDIENVPVDDKKTFEMLAKGETIGLFQLNGSGMTRFLVDLKPSVIHDINAMVALYRPGPMESIPEYIERKHDAKKIKYLDPRLKDILDQSYGVITYQDDVMMIAIKLAGYSWLEADKLRKAMGKKIPKEMQGEKEKLIKGLIDNGLSEKKSDQMWKLIEPFAAYGFNKAHAASYGKVAYQTAYMKANFPEIYMSAVLSAESGDTEMIAEIVAECKRMGIPVLPPDVNESYSQFTVVKDAIDKLSPQAIATSRIRFGLVTIKNFGQGVSTAIIDERKKGGKYKSLADFLDRVKDRNLNKKSLEALIKSGALDCLGEDRGVMLANIDLLLEYNKESGNKHSDQTSLFGMMSDHSSVPTLRLHEAGNADMRDKLAWEKELLGLYVSGHPLERYREVMAKKDVDIKRAIENSKDGASVIFAAIINEVRTVQTKNNETMAFIKISDFSGSSEAVVFPRTYREFRDYIVPDRCLAIKATLNTRNGERSFAIERVKGL
jgi:DNA polymerase-3 subunit alpha